MAPKPKDHVRPSLVLSDIYCAKIGRECLELFEMVDRAAGRAVDMQSQRELAVSAERLAKLAEMFS